MKQKWFISLLVLFFFLYPSVSIAQFAENKEDLTWKSLVSLVSPQHAFDYIKALSGPEMKGRQAGTSGARIAANYIEQLFQGFGLKGIPNTDKNPYKQTFEIPTFQITSTKLRMVKKQLDQSYQYRKDFTPIPYSAKGNIVGALSFVGYGIAESSLQWDDYKDINVKGKIVLMFRKSPDFISFPEENALFKTKIQLARQNGAAGVLIMDKPNEKNRFDVETKPVYTEELEDSLPAMFISKKTAEDFLLDHGLTVEDLYANLEEGKKPVSFDIKAGIEMEVSYTYQDEPTDNVIGIIPADNPATTEHIIICAHYDHLGQDLVNQTYFPGANDNASGTGVMLEIARMFSSFYFRPKIHIVFIAFTGEEEGLEGASHYYENPVFPLEDAKGVLNMDMVGTGTGKLYSGTDPKLFPLLTRSIEFSSSKTGVETVIYPNLLRGGSDHVVFAKEGIPSVFFIRSNPTGLGGYHSEDDTIDSIRLLNLEEQSKLVIGVVWQYTDASYFILDNSDPIWLNNLIYHPRVVLKGVGSTGVTGLINENNFQLDDSGILQLLIKVRSGSQVIHLEVLDGGKLVYEKYVSYNGDIKPDLIGDFNYDYSVNLYDAIFMAKQWDQPDNGSIETRLADINGDSIVNETDFTLFNTTFGYTINP